MDLKNWKKEYNIGTILVVLLTLFLIIISDYSNRAPNITKVILPTIEPTPTSSSLNGDSPIEMIGRSGGEERIYLRYGTIFAYNDSSSKEYRIVLDPSMHIDREYYNKMIFFETPEKAEIAGFKPSKDFAREHSCVKEGKNFYECYK